MSRRSNRSDRDPAGSLAGLVRSAGRFAWALGLLGARGAGRMLALRPPGSCEDFDALSRVAGGHQPGR